MHQLELDFWFMGGDDHLTQRRIDEPTAQSQGQLYGGVLIMRALVLFQLALCRQSPWCVDRTEFDADQKRLDLYLGSHGKWAA